MKKNQKVGRKASFTIHHYSKVFVSLILSFLAIMLLPTCAAVILGIHLLNTANDEIHLSSLSALNNQISLMESAFSDTINLSYKNSVNKSIVDYASSSQRQFFTEYKISRQLRDTLVGYDSITLLYLYLPQFDYVISCDGGSSSLTFFKKNYNGSVNGDYDTWIAQLKGSQWQTKSAVFSPSITGTNNQYALIQRVSHNNSTGFPVVVVTQLNSECIKKKIQDRYCTPYSEVVVATQDKIIFSTSSENAEQILKMSEKSKEKSVMLQKNTEKDSKKYLLLSRESRTYPFKITYAVSEEYQQKSMNFIWKYVLTILICCIIATVILCLCLARRNYRPVRKICSLIGNKVDAALTNEYEIIENGLRQYIKSNTVLTETFYKNVSEFQEMYLQKILIEKILYPSSIPEACALYNIDFINPLYAVVLFELTEDSVLFGEDKLNEKEKSCLTKLIVQNIVTEIFSQFCHIYAVEIGDNHVVVCNLPEESAENICKKLAKASKKANTVMNENFYINFNIYISDLYKQPQKLSEAYQETVNLSVVQHAMEDNIAYEKSHSDCIKRCISIIKEQYADNNLSLSEIADEISLNSSYVSRFFKQQMGVGLLDYLHRYRLSMAKLLMKEKPNIKLKDVAEQTGFYNVSAFIRVFKKLEGTTPGQFKNQFSSEELPSEEQLRIPPAESMLD